MIYLNPLDRLKDKLKANTEYMEEVNAKDRYTVAEMKAMCKDKGIVGYSKLKEQELIDILGL